MLKEKAGLNMLVQPTAGDNVIIPMVARGEAELGIANVLEVHRRRRGGRRQDDLRVIGVDPPAAHRLLRAQGRAINTIADLKGKRVALGYSAMRTLDMTRSAHAGDRAA